MALGLLAKQVVKGAHAGKAPRASDDLYEMAYLLREDTGLPVAVWVSPRGRARHAARVMVCRVPGNRMVESNAAAIEIEPKPHLIEGPLSSGELIQRVRRV